MLPARASSSWCAPSAVTPSRCRKFFRRGEEGEKEEEVEEEEEEKEEEEEEHTEA